MKNVSFFAAAAAVTAMAATPALAKDTVEPRSAIHAKSYKSMKMSSTRIQSRDAGYMRSAAQDRVDMRADVRSGRMAGDWNNRSWGNRRSGFWPADVVGGAIGTAGAVATTAVGTAGAIATAPFGGPYREGYAYRDSYAYGGPEYAVTYNYDGIAIPYSPNYAARNGFVCQPGTVFQNKAGQRQLCQ